MTQVSTIIEASFRELRALEYDRSVTRLQMAEALERLDSLVRSENGLDLGEQYTDWPLGNFGVSSRDQQYFSGNDIERPYENARLIHSAETTKTIYFPVHPEDGARMAFTDPFNRLSVVPITLDGNGRVIEGTNAVTLSTDGTDREWIYRADIGEWLRVTELQFDDEFPFPKEFDDYFIIGLAMRLDPRYKEEMNSFSLNRYAQIKKKFYGRYTRTKEVPSEVSMLKFSTDRLWGRFGRLTRRPYRNSTIRFDRGWN